MKRILTLLAALAFASPAWAQQLFGSSGPPPVGTPGNVPTFGAGGALGDSGAALAGTSLYGPCDIIAAGGQSCVAAQSVTRRLFGGYNGAIFQLTRASDSTTQDIGTTATGVYSAASVAAFCLGTSCSFSKIYDQTGNNNVLPQATVSLQAPWLIHPQKALPVIWTSQVLGYYRNRTATTNIPTGTASSTQYYVRATDVISGVGDYGRMENPLANCIAPTNCINGAMWALGYTNYQRWGAAAGVTIAAGLGVDNEFYETTVNVTSLPEFVTVLSKYNNSTNAMTHKYASVASGSLIGLAQGAPPTTPVVQNGISLGEGGDASLGGSEFFEGVIASGATSDATDAAIQTNISTFYNSFGAPIQGPSDVLIQPGSITSTTGLNASYAFGGSWGLRRMRASYTGYAAIITRASDSTSINVGFNGTGDFDDQTAQAFCAATTCYAQLKNQSLAYQANTPNSAVYDMTQATLSKQPTLVFNSLNGKSVLHFSGAQVLCTSGSIQSLGPTWGINTVARRTGANTSAGAVVSSNNTAGGVMMFAAATNTIQFETTYTNNITATLADASWASLTGINTNGGGSLYINAGTATTGVAASSGMSVNVCLGAQNTGGGLYLTGDFAEASITGTSITAAQNTALYANQHAYYGGAF